MSWKPISEFPFDKERKAYLFYCTNCECTFTGVFDNGDGLYESWARWRSFGGHGALPEEPSYFREIPDPPSTP